MCEETAAHSQARLLRSNQPVSSACTTGCSRMACATSSTGPATASLVACSRLATLPSAIGTSKKSSTSLLDPALAHPVGAAAHGHHRLEARPELPGRNPRRQRRARGDPALRAVERVQLVLLHGRDDLGDFGDLMAVRVGVVALQGVTTSTARLRLDDDGARDPLGRHQRRASASGAPAARRACAPFASAGQAAARRGDPTTAGATSCARPWRAAPPALGPAPPRCGSSPAACRRSPPVL